MRAFGLESHAMGPFGQRRLLSPRGRWGHLAAPASHLWLQAKARPRSPSRPVPVQPRKSMQTRAHARSRRPWMRAPTSASRRLQHADRPRMRPSTISRSQPGGRRYRAIVAATSIQDARRSDGSQRRAMLLEVVDYFHCSSIVVTSSPVQARVANDALTSLAPAISKSRSKNPRVCQQAASSARGPIS